MTVVNENAVNLIYMEEFGRLADGPGLTYWTTMLDTGAIDRAGLRSQLLKSTEGTAVLRKKVSAQYMSTLNRTGDAAGIDYWVSQIQGGNVPNDMKALGTRFLTFESPTPISAANPGIQDPTKQAPVMPADPALPPAAPIAPAKKSLVNEMRATLQKFGMNPTEEFLNQWNNEDWGDAEADVKLREQQFFKDRFPGMEGRSSTMSPAEYLAYEEGALSIFKSAGLPAGFYDDKSDFTEWIRSGRTLTQLNQQVEQGFVQLNRTPPAVREAFARMQGIANSDGALAAFFLDPDKATPIIEKQVATAEVYGAGSIFGIDVGDERARTLADRGFNFQNTQQTFQQITEQAGIFQESISETQDLSADVEGVNAAFGIDPDAGRTLQRRVTARRAQLSGGGGLAQTETGLAGRADQ